VLGSISVPFRRFLGDVYRELNQRVTLPVNSTEFFVLIIETRRTFEIIDIYMSTHSPKMSVCLHIVQKTTTCMARGKISA
jgi:hypothetical protein